MNTINPRYNVRPIIESYRTNYRKQRLQDTKLVDDDITKIFEQTEDDLIQKEQEVISWAISSYRHQR